MNAISLKQKEYLQRFQQRRRMPMEIQAEMFIDFLREKPKDEPLDPAWLEIWESLREFLPRFALPPVIEEIRAEVSKIQPIDHEVWDLRLGSKTSVTILLGAGASAPPPSNIPTVGQLLPELWRRAKKIGRDDLDRLAAWCNSRGIRNIEDLLTAAYIANFAAKNRGVTALLDYFLFTRGRDIEEEELSYRLRRGRPVAPEVDASSIVLFQETLQTLFGLLTSTMITAKPNPAHGAIVEFFKEHEDTTIVTTNYDGCMDEAILDSGMSLKADQLIKMHGSINWSYCDSCQDVHEFDLRNLKNAFEEDRLSYAVIGICRACGGQRRPLLVPPLSFKFIMFPNLVEIWNTARQRIESSDILLVVGYSFSEADPYVTKMISRSLTMKTTQKMVVCDPNTKLVPSIRERFSASIEGFDERRVLRAAGNCESLLPEILSSMLGKKEVTTGIPEKPTEVVPAALTSPNRDGG